MFIEANLCKCGHGAARHCDVVRNGQRLPAICYISDCPCTCLVAQQPKAESRSRVATKKFKYTAEELKAKGYHQAAALLESQHQLGE